MAVAIASASQVFPTPRGAIMPSRNQSPSGFCRGGIPSFDSSLHGRMLSLRAASNSVRTCKLLLNPVSRLLIVRRRIRCFRIETLCLGIFENLCHKPAMPPFARARYPACEWMRQKRKDTSNPASIWQLIFPLRFWPAGVLEGKPEMDTLFQ